MFARLRLLFAIALGPVACTFAANPAVSDPYGEWLEADAPFFSSVLDARKAGTPSSASNLTPRGIVLHAGGDAWVCFDPDLMRVAAVWRGSGVTPVALAPGSYHASDRKTTPGQEKLPEPAGKVLLANGIYPGWQLGERATFTDPRSPAPSPDEIGRGPIDADQARFSALRLTQDGVVLAYTVGNSTVREWIEAGRENDGVSINRHLEISARATAVTLVVGTAAPGFAVTLTNADGSHAVLLSGAKLPDGTTATLVRIPAGTSAAHFCVSLAPAGAKPAPVRAIPAAQPATRWAGTVSTPVTRAPDSGAYVVDEIELPSRNPWRRAIRASDIQFLADGTAFVVTLDGDVWRVRGLNAADDHAEWRRFASGLHEPMTLAIRDGEVFAFDRNGIWRLRDTDGNGEADVHELFANAFGQTADYREFPSTLRLGPVGEFYIAKGGQQATNEGKHNGSVLRISADGRTVSRLGYGFRQPNLSVNPRTGLVIASDQQGNYVPSTPLHIVRDNQFYGFLSPMAPKEKYPAPIAEPLTWIPHPVNASAISQVWLFDARMGALNDSLVHIGFNRPELFRVLLNERTKRTQAAVVSITQAFPFPPLNGSVNPKDGQLYVAGFQVVGWGTTSTRLAGLGRVRYTGLPSTLPREVVPMEQGVLLRFDVPLDRRTATDPASYTLGSWHYERTWKYGSPQLKADGKPGQDWMGASAAHVSRDGRSVFLVVPGMKPVMQMRVGWSLATADGRRFTDNAYFTPYELVPFRPEAEGFEALKLDATTAAVAARPEAATPVTAEEGARLAQLFGCAACHASELEAPTKIGPTWRGLYGRTRKFSGNAGNVTADEAYLRESILEPTAKLAPGFEKGEAGMPSYAGVLTAPQIDALILYIRSLK
jgi:glucose/arabinose dehydrogenase/cytochrome c2